VLITQTKTA